MAAENRERPGALTDREYRVAVLLARGITVKDIAARMELSRHSIYVYVRHAKEKAGARTQEHLVAIVVRKLVTLGRDAVLDPTGTEPA